jgi:hypothetical protein
MNPTPPTYEQLQAENAQLRNSANLATMTILRIGQITGLPVDQKPLAPPATGNEATVIAEHVAKHWKK